MIQKNMRYSHNGHFLRPGISPPKRSTLSTYAAPGAGLEVRHFCYFSVFHPLVSRPRMKKNTEYFAVLLRWTRRTHTTNIMMHISYADTQEGAKVVILTLRSRGGPARTLRDRQTGPEPKMFMTYLSSIHTMTTLAVSQRFALHGPLKTPCFRNFGAPQRPS